MVHKINVWNWTRSKLIWVIGFWNEYSVLINNLAGEYLHLELSSVTGADKHGGVVCLWLLWCKCDAVIMSPVLFNHGQWQVFQFAIGQFIDQAAVGFLVHVTEAAVSLAFPQQPNFFKYGSSSESLCSTKSESWNKRTPCCLSVVHSSTEASFLSLSPLQVSLTRYVWAKLC